MKTKLDDIEVEYRVAGDGEPVVMVHGLAQDHTMWRSQQDDLTDFTTYAYDIRGFGETTDGSPSGTLEQLGEDLVRFLSQVSGSAHCVGFSLGGTIALWAAAKHPELVRSAVVLGTSSVVGRSAAKFYASRIALVESGDAPAIRDAVRDDTAGALATDVVDLESQTEYRVAAVGEGRGYINAASAMARLNQEPLTPLLAEITSPVTVVGAEHDSFCPRKAADILLEGLPQASYVEIPSVGHLMVEETPDVSTKVIREALYADPGPTPEEQR